MSHLHDASTPEESPYGAFLPSTLATDGGGGSSAPPSSCQFCDRSELVAPSSLIKIPFLRELSTADRWTMGQQGINTLPVTIPGLESYHPVQVMETRTAHPECAQSHFKPVGSSDGTVTLETNRLPDGDTVPLWFAQKLCQLLEEGAFPVDRPRSQEELLADLWHSVRDQEPPLSGCHQLRIEDCPWFHPEATRASATTQLGDQGILLRKSSLPPVIYYQDRAGNWQPGMTWLVLQTPQLENPIISQHIFGLGYFTDLGAEQAGFYAYARDFLIQCLRKARDLGVMNQLVYRDGSRPFADQEPVLLLPSPEETPEEETPEEDPRAIGEVVGVEDIDPGLPPLSPLPPPLSFVPASIPPLVRRARERNLEALMGSTLPPLPEDPSE